MASKKQQKDQEQKEAPTDVATVGRGNSLPASVSGYDAEDIGAGFEGMTSEDYAIPFLGVLQKMHDQVDESSGAYIPGAKPGMIFNSVTNDLYDGRTKGIRFIPVHREHKFIEWVPRDSGGGFVAAYEPNDPVVTKAKNEAEEFGKYKTDEGNDLRETFSVYGIMLDDEDNTQFAIISFSSTMIKSYRGWMTRAGAIQLRAEDGRRFPAPLFSHVYRLRTVQRENAKGKWDVWDVSFAEGNAEASRLAPDSFLYQEAKAFRNLVIEGRAKADMSKSESAVNAPEADPDTF